MIVNCNVVILIHAFIVYTRMSWKLKLTVRNREQGAGSELAIVGGKDKEEMKERWKQCRSFCFIGSS
jgi:hypothetical protein